MKINIDRQLQNILPSFNIIGYLMEVENNETNNVKELLNNLDVDLKLENVTTDPLIKETRDGYKKLGKDPSHTRPACEALVRRVIKKSGIYSLGDLIDLGNILSVKTKRSVCVVDSDKIDGDVLIRIGNDGEYVEAIHRAPINASNLIVYTDNTGIFGSPTSDTMRTAVTKDTKNILVMIICFTNNNLKDDEELLVNLYQTYANAKNLIKI